MVGCVFALSVNVESDDFLNTTDSPSPSKLFVFLIICPLVTIQLDLVVVVLFVRL